MGVGLALALLLAVAAEARGGKYAVAQCGWYVGADAEWSDTTGGGKFRPDAFCVPAAGADPFDGVHVKSLTRDGQSTVSGNRFARWRWSAPAGTGIVQVRGTWWHALHDGLEQRLGAISPGGGFEPFDVAAGTDVAPREFVAGFAAPAAAFEDRLLCARAESKSCSLEAGSWSSLRALTITLQDQVVPAAGIGGELVSGGWLRGSVAAPIRASDVGSGIRYSETTLDGVRAAFTEHACAKASIGGEWRGTRMQPCAPEVVAAQSVPTTVFSDGLHTLLHCAADFSGNFGCAGPFALRIDNNPPAHPRSPELAGGGEWRRSNGFNLGWTNPDQGPASPIAGAGWRLSGPGGYDSGARFAPGRDRTGLADLSVPAAGSYTLRLWLRDEAGNEAPASAVAVPLRFDDGPPRVAFAAGGEGSDPAQVEATVEDLHSGPAAGSILYRRADSPRWTELPTKLVPGSGPGVAVLRAPTPELGTGTYLFRAEAVDVAGNAAASGLRADGTQMAIHRAAPTAVPRARTRLLARLRGGHGRGETLTIPFGAPAAIGGRLFRVDGAGLAGRELRVVVRPSRGALAATEVRTLRSGERGGFELALGPGPSRRVSVSFAGDGVHEPARRRPLELRVRAGVLLRVSATRLEAGGTLRFAGRVRFRGAAVPRRGKLVAIEYREQETGRWRPVLVTRTDHGGRFRASYRFRYLTGSARVRFRATALAEERWPYAPGSSLPLTVDVRGR